jgi:hypothetical protein
MLRRSDQSVDDWRRRVNRQAQDHPDIPVPLETRRRANSEDIRAVGGRFTGTEFSYPPQLQDDDVRSLQPQVEPATSSFHHPRTLVADPIPSDGTSIPRPVLGRYHSAQTYLQHPDDFEEYYRQRDARSRSRATRSSGTFLFKVTNPLWLNGRFTSMERIPPVYRGRTSQR